MFGWRSPVSADRTLAESLKRDLSIEDVGDRGMPTGALASAGSDRGTVAMVDVQSSESQGLEGRTLLN